MGGVVNFRSLLLWSSFSSFLRKCDIFKIDHWDNCTFVNYLVKVARVVNSKLAFANWLCKIQYLNLDKAPLFPRNQVICLKNWKLWRAPTTIKFNIFWWNFAHVSYLTMSTKGCSEYFFILFRSWIINKNVKNECVETRSFWFLQINQDLNEIKKNPEHSFVDIDK